MITGKVNLAALNHAVMPIPSKNGGKVDCIVIPIKENDLFKSDMGNVYLDFTAWEIPENKRRGDDTHIINQSLPKEKREALKKENKYAPTLGNMRDWDSGSGGGEQEPETNTDFSAPEGNDLPF